MGIIKEEFTEIGTIYKKYDSEGIMIQVSGAIGFVEKVRVDDSCSIKKYLDSFRDANYFIITNLHGNVIPEPTRYLNVSLRKDSFKKRELAFNALKLFFSFIDLYKITDYKTNFTAVELNKLSSFLKGGFQSGTYWDIEFHSIRSNLTINTYFSVYRGFFEEGLLTKESIFHKKHIKRYSPKIKNNENYTSNKKLNYNDKPPKYLKESEFKSILRLIEREYALRDKLIVILMYDYGLRLGEVLGLTIEDLIESNAEFDAIIIRNRVTDKPWQSAKGVMNVFSKDDYELPEYQLEGNSLGFQKVLLKKGLMELIYEYLDLTRDELLLNNSPKKKLNLESKSIADKVTSTNNLIGNENQYIFLSHQHFSPLTASGWNKLLHQILNKIGIATDKNKGYKENNLSHRFRHGFAMKYAKLGYSQEELRILLRHSSVESVSRYYNPDEKDRAELLLRQRNNDKGVQE